MHYSKRWLPLTLLLLLGFIWGTGYSLARFAMTNGVNPLGYSFWQSLGPAIVITFLTYANKERLAGTIPFCRYYLICGLTGIAIPNTNMYFASPHLPAGLLAVVVNTVPIMAYIMALLAKVETFNRRRLTAVGLGLAGLMCLLLPTASLPAKNRIPWVFISMLTPLSFAFCAVYITRYRPAGSHSLSLAAGTLISSSLLLMPLVFGTGNFYEFHFPLLASDWVILLEILLSSIGYILFFKLIKLAGPVYYSFVDTIVALTGLFWGYLIFNEKLNGWTATAVLLILLALLLVSKRELAVLKSEPSLSRD